MNDGVIGGEQLYQFFKETLNNYLLEEFDDFTLEKYERFNLICKWMCKFFVYLEKSYIPHNSLPMLHNTTRNIFSECYLNINKNNLFKSVTEKIRLYRELKYFDKSIINQYCKLFSEYNILDEFQRFLIEDSKQYFIFKSVTLRANHNLFDYLKQIEIIINNEIFYDLLKPYIIENMVKNVHQEILDIQFNTINDNIELILRLVSDETVIDKLSLLYQDNLLLVGREYTEVTDLVKFHQNSKSQIFAVKLSMERAMNS
jgi:hypothetical protein